MMGERYVTLGRREEGETYSPRGFGGRPTHDTNRTIYVGQLRYDTEERIVRKWFEAYGNVAAVKLIYDKDTGRSKGFGFVSFEDERDARDALNDASGRDLDGAAIKVNIAHGPAAMAPFAGRGRGGRGGFIPGRGAGPYGYRGRGGAGFDRRPPGGDHYSPGRYSPRSRSRSRSPGRRHERDDRERSMEGDDRGEKRRRRSSPSRSRSRNSSRSRSRSRSRSSRSRSATPASQRNGLDHPSPAGPAAAPATADPSHALPPVPAAITPPAAAPASEHTPPGMGVAAATAAAVPPRTGGKPPPSAEAVKKELLRLRKQEAELGGRVRSLQDELARRERQLAQRDRELAEAKEQLAALQPQLRQHKQWVAALLAGAADLSASRRAVAEAEAAARRSEERLAAIQQEVAGEAAHHGVELADGAGYEHGTAADDDAAWEQLAADIQESEREAAAAAADSLAKGGGAEGGAPPPPRAASDTALQAAMQDVAMEEEEATDGWTAANGGQSATGGGRFEGIKFAVAAA